MRFRTKAKSSGSSRVGPIEPAQFIILAIAVIIALLAARQLIAQSAAWGVAGRKQQGREKITLLAASQLDDGFVFRLAFRAAVPGQIIAVAVSVVLAIGFIVALVVADEILRREPIMRGDEIHRSPGLASGIGVKLGGAREPCGESRKLSRIARARRF